MFLVRAALCGLGLGGLNKLHDITDSPKRLSHASGNRGRRAQRRMYLDEIVIHHVERDA